MLEAIAGRELLDASYAAAVAEGYRWHEFGDSHLILPYDAWETGCRCAAYVRTATTRTV